MNQLYAMISCGIWRSNHSGLLLMVCYCNPIQDHCTNLHSLPAMGYDAMALHEESSSCVPSCCLQETLKREAEKDLVNISSSFKIHKHGRLSIMSVTHTFSWLQPQRVQIQVEIEERWSSCTFQIKTIEFICYLSALLMRTWLWTEDRECSKFKLFQIFNILQLFHSFQKHKTKLN